MSWAIVAVGAVTVIGGAMSADAAKGAAGAQSKAAQEAMSAQQAAARTASDRLSPYLDVGNQANSKLATLLGLQDPNGPNGNNFQPTWNLEKSANWKSITDPIYAQYGVPSAENQVGADQGNPAYIAANIAAKAAYQKAMPEETAANTPGYGSLTAPFTQTDLNNDVPYNTSLQFGLDEGEKAINRGAAAHGSLDSGAAAKAIARYATDYGGTKATDAYNRSMAQKSQIYGMLSGEQSQGSNAASNMGNITMGNAANISNLMTQQGNANSAGIIGSSNALSSGVASGVNAYNQGNILNSLTGGGARGGSAGNPPPADSTGGAMDTYGF